MSVYLKILRLSLKHRSTDSFFWLSLVLLINKGLEVAMPIQEHPRLTPVIARKAGFLLKGSVCDRAAQSFI